MLLFPPDTILPTDIEYINFDQDEFFLRFSPFSLTGTESFLIKCTIKNQIDVIGVDGQLKQRVQGTSPTFSPAIQLSFLISSAGSPEFAKADITTFISCQNSPLAGSGFRPFLTGGSVITTAKGFNFDKDTKDLGSSSRAITRTTDLNGRMNFEINKFTITEPTLDRILKDDFDYTTTISVRTTGTLLFAQCLATNPNCPVIDATAVWEHNISPNDAFTAFGLIVEGKGFAPLSEQQEIQIITQLEAGGKHDVSENDRPRWKVRIKNYSPQETIPIVKTFWLGDPDPFSRSKPVQIVQLGLLTKTEEGGTFHVKEGSYTIPITKLGQYCYELQPDETGIRKASKKCLIAYDGTKDPIIEDPEVDVGGTSIDKGELRIQYEVSTSEKIFKNDITTTQGIPITFDPLGIVGAGTPNSVIYDIFIQPQLFFDPEILKNLNVISSSSEVIYTGTIDLEGKTIKIPNIDLRPSDSTFTSNQASIKLPATKITGNELEEILIRNGVSTTSTTQASLEINIGGKILLEETGSRAQWVGVLEGAQFTWNFDYVPAKSNDIIDDTDSQTCSQQGGTIINQVCVIPDDISTCFDGLGNEVDCNIDNKDTAGNNDNVKDDAGNLNTAQCFDQVGNEIICDEEVPADCDVNTDPDRCGGGQIQGSTNPNDDIGGTIPEPTLCLGLPFIVCAESTTPVIATELPPLNLGIGDTLTEYAIVIGAGVGLILVIAIIIRLAKP